MKFRLLAVIAAVLAGATLTPSLQAQMELKMGEEKFKGELTKDAKKDWGGGQGAYYTSEMFVSLKAGQSIAIDAIVLGEGRQVRLRLYDPTGAELRTTGFGSNYVNLTFTAVSATGNYKAVIGSPAIGLFSMVANDPYSPNPTGPALKLGEKFEGELSKDPKKDWGGGQGAYYTYDLFVSLKAGQSISIDATVLGEARQARLRLLDPTGAELRTTGFGLNHINLTFTAVSATGNYKIMVGSPAIGLFSVTANEAPVKALEARIGQLERELAEARARLAGLKKK